MSEPRGRKDFGPRREFRERDDRRRSYKEKVEAKAAAKENDWVDGYMSDMAKESVPMDWIDCAFYHLKGISKKIQKIQIHRWKPSHVDTQYRMIDEAQLWCSALIDEQPYGVLLNCGPQTTYEFFPGDHKTLPVPF